MANIYALLVGIDEYKNTDIPPLLGCVNDITSYVDIFKEQYKGVFIPEVITNKDATKDNIVDRFREHLVKQATAEDVALFVYAGHGARSKAALEFNDFFADGFDEGIVCHDSRTESNPYDLVDKEVALLIRELAKKQTHIAFILDSCHSGSSTRSVDILDDARTRSLKAVSNRGGFLANNQARDLETYISSSDFNYAEKLSDGKKDPDFDVPSAKHVLMAACRRTQEAKESNGRGRFSVSLQTILAKRNFDISYAELFAQVRNNMLKNPGQDPQFQTYGEFNGYTKFLGNNIEAKKNVKVFFRNDDPKGWVVDQGAINNIPTDTTPTEIAILDKDDNQIATARTTTVLLNQSLIELPADKTWDKEEVYSAQILSLPLPPEPVAVMWDKAGQEALEKALQDYHGIEFIPADTLQKDALADIEYGIDAQNGQIRINRLSDGVFVHGAESYTQAKALLDDIMLELVKFKRTKTLQNQAVQDSSLIDFFVESSDAEGANKSSYEVFLDPSTLKDRVKLTDSDKQPELFDSNQFVLTYNAPDGKEDDQSFDVNLEFLVQNNHDKDLHALLLYLDKNYKIIKRSNEVIPPKGKQNLYKTSMFLDAGIQEETYWYKLIVSPEKVDDESLIKLEGLELGKMLPSTRGERGDAKIKSKKLDNNWFTKTCEIKLIRQNKEIKGDEKVSLDSMGIEIDPHPTLRAKANTQKLEGGSRAVNSQEGLYIELAKHGISMAGTAPSTGAASSRNVQEAPPQVLELDITQDADLAKDPLTMTMNAPLGDEEMLLPMAFDGEHFILVGEAEQDGGKTKISIHDAPATTINRRSLGKALKLYFFKTVVGKNVNKLSHIDFSRDEPVYTTEDIKERVNEATNILLVLHGIIGSTKSIVNELPNIYDARELRDKKNLVLAYDYENLGTKVPETAAALKASLLDLGIGASDDKNITVLAHSMGGLVTRWFVEQLDGKSMIDHVVLAGTPSGGSPFGKIEEFKTIFKTLTELSMNFLPPAVPFVAGLLTKAMRNPASLIGTLTDMSPSSDMLEELNDKNFADPGIPYTILAGNVDAFKETSDKFVAKLLEKIGKNDIYDSMFGGPRHDIAVSLESIKSVNDAREPAPVKYEIACHHMNYFNTDVSVDELKKIAWMA